MELVCKREKLKKEQVCVKERVLSLKLCPLNVLLRHTLQQLENKDTARVFCQPVNTCTFVDYLSIIKQPMDFCRMRDKIEAHEYSTVGDLKVDFELMMNNCLEYNGPQSQLYSYTLRLQTQGELIIDAAERMSRRANYCEDTGQHNNSPTDTFDVDSVSANDAVDAGVSVEIESLEKQVKLLLKRLDMLQHVNSHRNVYLARHLRRQVGINRRTITRLKHQQATPTPLPVTLRTPPTYRLLRTAAPPSVNDRRRDSSMSSAGSTYDQKTLPDPVVSCHDVQQQQQQECSRWCDVMLDNDSSYESSYSVLSDSDHSSDTITQLASLSRPATTPSLASDRRETRTSSSTVHRGSLVWAKTTGFPWYPAMVFVVPGDVSNGTKCRRHVATPPSNVMSLRSKYSSPVYLVRYFNKQRNWQWLPRQKLELLGRDSQLDMLKLSAVQSLKRKTDVRLAFDKALECRID